MKLTYLKLIIAGALGATAASAASIGTSPLTTCPIRAVAPGAPILALPGSHFIINLETLPHGSRDEYLDAAARLVMKLNVAVRFTLTPGTFTTYPPMGLEAPTTYRDTVAGTFDGMEFVRASDELWGPAR